MKRKVLPYRKKSIQAYQVTIISPGFNMKLLILADPWRMAQLHIKVCVERLQDYCHGKNQEAETLP
jgi:hypothetical protein